MIPELEEKTGANLNFHLRISNRLTIVQDIRECASASRFLRGITQERFRIIPNIISQLFFKPSLQLLDMVSCLVTKSFEELIIF